MTNTSGMPGPRANASSTVGFGLSIGWAVISGLAWFNVADRGATALRVVLAAVASLLAVAWLLMTLVRRRRGRSSVG